MIPAAPIAGEESTKYSAANAHLRVPESALVSNWLRPVCARSCRDIDHGAGAREAAMPARRFAPATTLRKTSLTSTMVAMQPRMVTAAKRTRCRSGEAALAGSLVPHLPQKRASLRAGMNPYRGQRFTWHHQSMGLVSSGLQRSNSYDTKSSKLCCMMHLISLPWSAAALPYTLSRPRLRPPPLWGNH